MDNAPVADRTETAPPVAGPAPSDAPTTGCPFPHDATASQSAGPIAPDVDLRAGTATAPALGGCPVPHGAVDMPAEPALDRCPVPHGAVAAAAPAQPAPASTEAARCPVPHVARAAEPTAAAAVGGCPVMHGPGGVHRTPADLVVRRALRIKERPPGVSAASAYSTFQKSMLISATRCTLTYVLFPFVLPAAGFARGVGPMIGVIIGSLALVCDTFTIRRFFAVDHKWRWYFSSIAFGIMCLLSVLLVQDVSHIVGDLIT